jgi:symplekin
VQQHVELAFALSRRQQDLLNDIFQLYPKMEPEIQDAVDDLLEPLIQSLGPTEKLLSILREFPEGAEKLALRVVTVLSAGGASPVLLGLLKGLMAERDLDPRFIIPIIGELDKVSWVSTPRAKGIASTVSKLTRPRARLRGRSRGSCPCSARGREGTSSVRRSRRCCRK